MVTIATNAMDYPSHSHYAQVHELCAAVATLPRYPDRDNDESSRGMLYS